MRNVRNVRHLPLVQRSHLERDARPSSVRAQTIDVSRISKRALAANAEPTPEHWRPRTRGECMMVPRPCPFVSCKWNLYLDLTSKGNIKLNFGAIDPDAMPGTGCALDVADLGGVSWESLGPLLNVTRERMRQIKTAVLEKLGPDLQDEANA